MRYTPRVDSHGSNYSLSYELCIRQIRRVLRSSVGYLLAFTSEKSKPIHLADELRFLLSLELETTWSDRHIDHIKLHLR